MKIFGIAGYSGMGQDSCRLRESSCQDVLLPGHGRWAPMHQLRGAEKPSLDDLRSRLQRCDLALIEGFNGGDFPKLGLGVRAVSLLRPRPRCHRTPRRDAVSSRSQRRALP